MDRRAGGLKAAAETEVTARVGEAKAAEEMVVVATEVAAARDTEVAAVVAAGGLAKVAAVVTNSKALASGVHHLYVT